MSQRYRPNSRANLGLGAEYNTPPQSGRSTPYSYNANANGSGSEQENPYAAGPRFMDNLEAQNDEMIEGLGSKIKMLKDLSLGIGDEVREGARQLSQMNDAFEETGSILSGTFKRMNRMATRQGCRWMWYMVFGVVVFWFFIVVWWFRR
ncbi:unnamed protein product [Peniophora sp. CBMAI 1063]|nr:unnamed protein product [Peniophora sp. CBMAI 1063]